MAQKVPVNDLLEQMYKTGGDKGCSLVFVWLMEVDANSLMVVGSP